LAETLAALNRREEAIEAARRALDLEPHAAEELVRAEALFRSLKAFPELARVLESRARLGGDEDREAAVALLLESAQIHAEQLRKPESGASALERVLEIDPTNERATAELKRIYTKTGDWRRYATLLDRLANQAEDPVGRVALLKELALVQEQKLGEKELAFLALCRAIQSTPLDEALAEGALRVARAMGSLEELVEVYENVVDSLGASPDVEGVLLRLAQLQDSELDQPKAAEDSLRRLLALQPGNQKALDALGQLFVRRGRSREYVVTMEQKVETIATIEEKKQVLLTLSRAYDELLGEPADAVLTLRRALELDPGDGAIVDQLAAILRREKAWPDLVALLRRAREMVSDPLERSKLQLQIAEITELWLDDDEGALSAYHLALELDPQSWSALEALEKLYTRLDRGAELLRVYDRQIDLVELPDRAKILFKAAQIWEQKLANTENAVACLEGVLQIDASSGVALRELERLYREERDWERLAMTYQRHLEIVHEHQEVVALHVALGDLLYRELGRADQAEMLYTRALEVDPTSQPALRGLGQLYEGSGNWAQSLEMIRREIRLASSSEQAVQLYTRAGHIFEEMLLDLSEAEGAYRRALEIEPTYLPALRALKRLSFERKDWDSYIDAAKQEAQVAPEGPEKAQLHHEIARFYQDVREDTENAERHYLEALRRMPSHLDSARPLSDIYVAKSDWEPAERMLDVVVAEMRTDDARELCRQYYRLGYVAEKLDHTEKALEAYRRAYELDATYLPALEGLGSLLVRGKHFDEALRIYQAILIHHREELTDLEVVEIYWQIGEIHRALSQLDRAQKSYEKALEIDPSHEPSHQAAAELLEGVGNYEQALEHRQKLLETLEGDARFEASVQLARLARERLGDPYQAVDAYTQALRARPDSVAVMEALLSLYRETKQGQKAMEILERMLEQPLVKDDPTRERDLRVALAEVYRDEVRDVPRAIEEFNRALDLDPGHVQAFAAIEALLTEGEQWQQLEESYHAMIKRLPKTPEAHQARMALWKALGELYQKVLKNREGALLAYEVVMKAEPENGPVVELLAELYAGTPGKEQQAIEAHRRALLTTTDPVKVVKTLVRLHASLKEYDKAYVAAQVLVYLLGERSPDEEQIIVRLKRYAKETAQRSLTERNWSEALTHERLKSPLAEILGICQTATAGTFAVDPTRLNINRKKDKVDVQSSMLFFVNMFKYVAKTLAMETLELFKVPGHSGLTLGNTFPPCLLAGEDMFKDRSKRELYFVIAKAMAFSRPELAMARLLPPEELEVIVQAAVALVAPEHPITGDAEAIERTRRKIEKTLSEAARQPLSRAVREVLRDPSQLDLRSYLEGVEHTANRAGVLLCTDVEVAMRCFAQDQGAAARLPLRAKVRDLMTFCLGEPYFKLRQSLGLSVDVRSEGRASP
jgi:tetratricopeptide (TPR) repeat protein